MVVLAPAAADVLARLEAGPMVVGVTNTVTEFPEAARVGTHRNPGIEAIAAQRPSLLIAGPRFDPDLAQRLGCELYIYDPRTLDQIITTVRALGVRLHRKDQGEALAGELQAALDGLSLPKRRPTALFEARSTPLSVAGNSTITRDLLERAGMQYAFAGDTGLLAEEYLMAHQPEYYLYQSGPMNRNPLPPKERRGWSGFAACSWQVDEFAFSRANTRIFETLVELNALLNMEDPCAAGHKAWPANATPHPATSVKE